jgi:gas vesicle protein
MSTDFKRFATATSLGLLIGGAAGFAAGLLVAPDEGKNIRRRLAYLLDRWVNQVSELVDHLSEPALESHARRTGDALIAEAREQAERILSDADALMREVRQRQGPSQ